MTYDDCTGDDDGDDDGGESLSASWHLSVCVQEAIASSKAPQLAQTHNASMIPLPDSVAMRERSDLKTRVYEMIDDVSLPFNLFITLKI
jgi:hypothetical protein